MIKVVASDPTAEELEAILSHPNAFYEIVDGEIVEKPQMSAFSRLIARRLFKALDEIATAQRLGTAVHEWMLVLDPARPLKRQPDVAFVSFERWPVDREIPEEGEWETIPDLAVEILSPRDLGRKTARKIREYFRYGVKQVWIIQPETREIYVYESPKRILVLDEEDDLDGGEIVRGFRLPVAELFRRTVS
ncbi:MAG: hypothetical protein JWN86_1176 [Planctomycetota bacterium]|nr:hypothetical protein [Planctomycetota bacterium]